VLNPAIVQAMTCEALCESLVRIQREAEEQRQRGDRLQARVAELEQQASAKPAARKSAGRKPARKAAARKKKS
jgi:cell division protein FtsB